MPIVPRSDDWRIFHGEASPAEARIYVQLRLESPAAFDRLRGEITGPFSRYARTLSATRRFDVSVTSTDVMAETVLPDPCFWTPELPYLYRVRLTLDRAGDIMWAEERTFGIRRLGVQGRRLYFEAKNWVLRGAFADESPEFAWDDWRELHLAPIVRDPSEDFCTVADQRGVVICAVTTPDVARLNQRLSGWQRHPSVGMIFIHPKLEFAADLCALSRNSIFAAGLVGDPQRLPDWADVALWTSTNANPAAGISSPILAIRPLSNRVSPAELREGCDALQRDLVGVSEFAGYLV